MNKIVLFFNGTVRDESSVPLKMCIILYDSALNVRIGEFSAREPIAVRDCIIRCFLPIHTRTVIHFLAVNLTMRTFNVLSKKVRQEIYSFFDVGFRPYFLSSVRKISIFFQFKHELKSWYVNHFIFAKNIILIKLKLFLRIFTEFKVICNDEVFLEKRI